METPITEFVLFKPKQPSPAFDSVISALKSVQGVDAVYHGSQLEDQTTHVFVIRWTSHDAFTAFSSSEAYTPWLADFKALAADPRFYQVRFTPSATPALDAPCTEVVVAYGIRRAVFVDNLHIFSDRMTEGGRAGSMEGWHANAWGEVTTPLPAPAGGAEGHAAVLLVGWDSKEAHLNAKAVPGPISDNIELIRKEREALTMLQYHVNLNRL
ncbi:hypothetical protein SODALDRAFT_324939 [Sodiomyces alkalinus F11]|uniref:ABM domain-containing protein n=1 Tax=Sodiomyces alkalinus (strain CBS 110278 / VKM F-3762 / F11) TaxID=1314773 RepID=A0A3N2PS32_SODAK|nr:hypothetical protein SODALDRAFT_324939 [Sodiomyces alkalinus F11]ROT37315.1 hypothetical protein SODALDRAFT_324939 [Sodiomyces alkalinus F11]